MGVVNLEIALAAMSKQISAAESAATSAEAAAADATAKAEQAINGVTTINNEGAAPKYTYITDSPVIDLTYDGGGVDVTGWFSFDDGRWMYWANINGGLAGWVDIAVSAPDEMYNPDSPINNACLCGIDGFVLHANGDRYHIVHAPEVDAPNPGEVRLRAYMGDTDNVLVLAGILIRQR